MSKHLYRMPAEWEKQKSTIVAWPHNKNDWPNKFFSIPHLFAEIISKISKYQKVNILIQRKRSIVEVANLLNKFNSKNRNINYLVCKTNRSWTRDSVPTIIKYKNKKKIFCNWKFNAWAKYKNFKQDEKICQNIKKYINYDIIKPVFKKKRIVLEGGSIDVNGDGLLLTSKECLLSNVQQRNPGLNRRDYEFIFNKYLGVKKVIWLNKGIVGDDTHGHIDDIARFVSKNRIFLAYENKKKDKNFKNLNENYNLLKKFNFENVKFKITKIPMPKPIFIDKIRVPATYLNFYIANKIVLLPIFDDPNDKIVINIFRREFKNRKIIPINCRNLIWGFGAIHCLTQQEPA